MRLLVPLVLLAAAAAGGCAFPGHVAEATLERSVPAAGIAVLDCRTHNGDIVLRARPGADTLQVHAALSVRGHTPEAAAANLSHLRVEPRLEGDRLVLAGEYDSEVRSLSPSFAFTIEGPPELVMELESHNGSVRALAVAAPVTCETHNGDIVVEGAPRQLRVKTHNGRIELEIGGVAVDGTIESHNGNVVVVVGREVGAAVEASTHNGSIRLGRESAGFESSHHRLSCRLGDGAGRLAIETHNGNVEIR